MLVLRALATTARSRVEIITKPFTVDKLAQRAQVIADIGPERPKRRFWHLSTARQVATAVAFGVIVDIGPGAQNDANDQKRTFGDGYKRKSQRSY
jgi:hypothetical protein